MELPMTISVQDVDCSRSYSNNGSKNMQRPKENKDLEGGGEGVEGVQVESRTEDDDHTEVEGSQLEGISDKEGNNQTGHHFQVHQLRGGHQPAVPTAFLPWGPQLVPVRNGQLYPFSSILCPRIWALVKIQYRPGVAPTRASVERELWRQAHCAGRRRDRRRMLSDLDHHTRHDNLGQRSLRTTSATLSPWNIASDDPTFGQQRDLAETVPMPHNQGSMVTRRPTEVVEPETLLNSFDRSIPLSVRDWGLSVPTATTHMVQDLVSENCITQPDDPLPLGQILSYIRPDGRIPVQVRVQGPWGQQSTPCVTQSTPQSPMVTGNPVLESSTNASASATVTIAPHSITSFSLPPRASNLQDFRTGSSAFPSTPARTITYTLLGIQQLQDAQSLALRETELADLRAMRSWPRNQRPLATWKIFERERGLQVELIEVRTRMAERERQPECWDRSGPARRIGRSVPRLSSQWACKSRSLSPPLGDGQNTTAWQRTSLSLMRDQSEAKENSLTNNNGNTPPTATGEPPWTLREYDGPEVVPVPAEDTPQGIPPASNEVPGSGEENTQASQPRPLIRRGGPGVPGGRTWATGWSRQPYYVMRCIIQYCFASMDRWSRQPFYALRGVMRDYNYRSRATKAQAAVLWEYEQTRITRAEAHMRQQLATIDSEDVNEYHDCEVLAYAASSVAEEFSHSRPSSPSHLRPARALLQQDKTLIEPPKVRMRGGAPPWAWHPSGPNPLALPRLPNQDLTSGTVILAAESNFDPISAIVGLRVGLRGNSALPGDEDQNTQQPGDTEESVLEGVCMPFSKLDVIQEGDVELMRYRRERESERELFWKYREWFKNMREVEDQNRATWEQHCTSGRREEFVAPRALLSNIQHKFVTPNSRLNASLPSQPQPGHLPESAVSQDNRCTPQRKHIVHQIQIGDCNHNSNHVDLQAAPQSTLTCNPTEESQIVYIPGKNTKQNQRRRVHREAKGGNERGGGDARQGSAEMQGNANEQTQEIQGDQETSPLQDSKPPSQDAAASAGSVLTPAPSVISTLTAAPAPNSGNTNVIVNIMRVPDLDINLVNDNSVNLFFQREREKGLSRKFLPCQAHWPHLHHSKLNTGDSECKQIPEINMAEFDNYLEFLAQNAEEQWKFRGSNKCAVDAENLICTGITHVTHSRLLRGVDFILESLDRLEQTIALGLDEKGVVEQVDEHGEQLMEIVGLVKILVTEMLGDEGSGIEEERGDDMEGEDDTNSMRVDYDSDMELVNIAFEEEKDVLSDEEIEEYRLRHWREWNLYVAEYMKSGLSEEGIKVISLQDEVGFMCKKERDNRSLDPWGYCTSEKGK
ncbi:hypothetical protein L211DRAFT_886242 [Terfezia boudieri ATCC MYA-4762]|uniref:Uncharacterized protein n=1 Tax=Terfezia boudieri ATCC MYA-4762 TaxID=1051890 RepID=A0A3N4LVI8_9PEZI|nr:hypothetical protein L211DRAFT_886242 [Terfezia boudieri ATCC MYA-4762]